MSKYIMSTCGQPQVFTFNKPYKKNDPSMVAQPETWKAGPNKDKPIEIKIGGGAYVLDRSMGRTRKVTVTEITDDEYEMLKSNSSYQFMKSRGFFTEYDVPQVSYDTKGNPADMEKHDNTSQLSDAEHADGSDDRCNHASTRATAGINNQNGGNQPASVSVDNYGPIHI